MELRDKIIKVGMSTFNNFIPIVNHLDYTSYFSILKKCRNVIMGHIRQQALGTISTSIYLGANLFLYKESILFKHFHSIGIKVKSIEDLLENPNLLNYEISEEELITVREILISKWGKDFNEKSQVDFLNLLKN
jgi:hypothetical protein